MSIILYIMQFSFEWQNRMDDSELSGTVHVVEFDLPYMCARLKKPIIAIFAFKDCFIT